MNTDGMTLSQGQRNYDNMLPASYWSVEEVGTCCECREYVRWDKETESYICPECDCIEWDLI